MDAIQLAQDLDLKGNIHESRILIFNQKEILEASYPLLASYLAELREINNNPNHMQVMYEQEQKFRIFKFLCKQNLLFFLTVTGQFNLIETLFSIQQPMSKLQHLIVLIKKEQLKIHNRKKLLLDTLSLQQKQLQHQKQSIHNLSNIHIYVQALENEYRVQLEIAHRDTIGFLRKFTAENEVRMEKGCINVKMTLFSPKPPFKQKEEKQAKSANNF